MYTSFPQDTYVLQLFELLLINMKMAFQNKETVNIKTDLKKATKKKKELNKMNTNGTHSELSSDFFFI